MYVCICAAVTDRQIKHAVGEGANSLEDLAGCLGVGTGCGCCREMAQEVLDDHVEAVAATLPFHAREIARVAAAGRGV